MKVSIEFEPRDLWIGVYWKVETTHWVTHETKTLTLYICLIPTLPLVVTLAPKRKEYEEPDD